MSPALSSAGRVVGALAALSLAPRAAWGQERRPTAHPAPAAPDNDDRLDRRDTGERVILGLASLGFGLRTGAVINDFAGVTLDRDGALAFAVPTALAVALPTALVLADSRWPTRRGRILAGATGLGIGYFATLAVAMQMQNASLPDAATLAGPPTWIGSALGIAAGLGLGALTDAGPGPVIYAGLGGIGGAALGATFCGTVQCRGDLGAYTLAGELVGLTAALATARWVRPTQREMRWTVLGAVLGGIPMVGVWMAHWIRDGELGLPGLERGAPFGLVGVAAGAALAFAITRGQSHAP